MNFFQKMAPWLLLGVMAVWLLSNVMPRGDKSAFNYDEAGMILVTGDGRVKPLDTVARASLVKINGSRQEALLDGEKVPAIQWLFDMLANRTKAEKYDVIEITHPEVLGLMGIYQTDKKMFSLEDIIPHINKIEEQMRIVASLPSSQEPTPVQKEIARLGRNLTAMSLLMSHESPYLVPPLGNQQDWQPLRVSLMQQRALNNPAVEHYRTMLSAYAANDARTFNAEVNRYNALLSQKFPREFQRAKVEMFYNHFAPFYQSTVLYGITFLLACAALLVFSFNRGGWAIMLRNSAALLILLTFVLHTFGILLRIYLHGRPPVTNLYSSAVFIGWACVPLGLAVEFIMKRMSVGLIAGALAGFATGLIAQFLSLEEGDTMKNMQAVLDTNFWLATHVPTVVIGYSATFLAGLLAIVYILLGVFTPVMTRDIRRDFTKAVYGVICFAMLLSFVGTVLGGIWADQSWGRFWGWDPKENGAVLIVLCNALILHARWGGMIRERGMMVLAVLGNIVTAWSWFGTNMLGVGLHSYGFMDKAVMWMAIFMVSQLAIIGIGCTPLSAWRSYNEEQVDRTLNARGLTHGQPKPAGA